MENRRIRCSKCNTCGRLNIEIAALGGPQDGNSINACLSWKTQLRLYKTLRAYFTRPDVVAWLQKRGVEP